MKTTLAFLFATSALVGSASADLVVTLRGTEPDGAAVKLAQPAKEPLSATSARFKASKTVRDRAGESDRDLGQTFLTGDEGFFLDRITFLLGAQPIAPSVFGAKVSVQLFEISGTATVNDNGTKTGNLASWSDDPRVDDFIVGERYTTLATATKARMPAFLMPGQFVVLNFREGDRISLKPNTRYGFLFMFDEAAPDRSLAFATSYWGEHADGHAIRREGAVLADVKKRTATQPTTKAGTKSDVFSDLVFWVEGSDTAPADQAIATANTAADEGPLPLPKR